MSKEITAKHFLFEIETRWTRKDQSEHCFELAKQMCAEKDKEIQKLRKASEEILHLHLCEQEGLSSGQPTPKQWIEAVNKLSEALNNIK